MKTFEEFRREYSRKVKESTEIRIKPIAALML